ncbi:MAG TPA: OmpH family outer membrane protein [Acetobacteraceae bacterium]|nr:OmpH family outer membrane protein [Acetobacteraceae bacterium]
MKSTRLSRALLLSAAALSFSVPAWAQSSSGPGWFIPGQGGGGAGTRAAPRAAAPSRTAAPAAAEPATPLAAPAEAETAAGAPGPAPVQMQLPPPPTVPDVPRGAMPPAAVIGVISIPDVLRASTAYREADKIVAERRQKLNEDAQKEEVALRDLGQQLANDRAKLSAEQVRAREKELQDRIAESRRKFSERGRIIQEASQYALAQIERTLSDVVQRVAAAHGMNLVLQRAEVALNQAEFDITPEAANLLNKTLTSVVIPPDGVEPPVASANAPSSAAEAAADKAAATASAAPAPAKPASAGGAPQHR